MAAIELLDLYPDKATYHPGEPAHLWLHLACRRPFHGTARLHLSFLADTIDRQETNFTVEGVGEERLRLPISLPLESGRGYGVTAELVNGEGAVVARGATALDVLEDWTLAPRYGFVSDFPSGRAGIEEVMRWLVRHHINGLQFYDWMYRHDDLLTEDEPYQDPLGRSLSRETIARLIEAARRHNIASMAYVAVYGASVAYWQTHPEEALYDGEGRAIPFGEDFLYIMNPAPESPWTAHLMAEFAEALRFAGFDGIHIDQYGFPKEGFDHSGNPVDLPEAFRAFIDRTKESLLSRNPRVPVVFNAVGNWPIAHLTRSRQSFPYIEVWPPDTRYADLWAIITNASALSGGKPPVLAAYIPPSQPYNVRLANAVIFASGGYHIELGESGRMLADPYFPKHEAIGEPLAAVLRRYYDFAVQYENVLALDTVDVTPAQAHRIAVQGAPHSMGGAAGSVWTLVREGAEYEVIHFINLSGLPTAEWTEPLTSGPTPLADLKVRFQTPRPVRRVWLTSPNFPDLRAMPLPFDSRATVDSPVVEFSIPSLEYWTVVVVEYQ